MKMILVVLVSIVINTSVGLQETWGIRTAGRVQVDPCMQETCPQISTNLFSQAEYYHRRKGGNSNKLKNNSFSLKKKNAEINSKSITNNITAQQTYYGIEIEPSDRTVKRKRKHVKRNWTTQRHRRSQARTIMSLNTNHTMDKVKMDPTRFWSNKKCHKYAMFKVFGEDFTLCLLLGNFLSDPILAHSGDLKVSVYGPWDQFRSRRLSSMYLQIAEGHVLGQVYSSVRGYVWRDKFYGTVITETDTLHIEPLLQLGPIQSKYVKNSDKLVNAYVYRVFSKLESHNKKKERRNRRNRAYWLYKRGEWKRLKRYYKKYYKKFRLIFLRAKKISRRRRTKRSTQECKSCGLLLIADTSFYEEVGEMSVKQTVLQMLFHIRESNILIRKQDFDNDGYSDCVGVHVAGIGVLASKTSVNNLFSGEYKTSEEYLRTFSRYQLDGFCLAVLFSSKVFSGKVLGLSWRGDHEKAGGICQTRTNVGTSEKPEMYNLNSLFITVRTKKTSRIPLRMGVLNLAHEILHSFGASHDPKTCTPSDPKSDGRYLMSKYSSSGVKKNNEIISNCTAKAITETLSSPKMSFCLHQLQPGYCGDGVVGHDEECDCGPVEMCLEKKSLCVPPGKQRGETECTVRKLLKYDRNKGTTVKKQKQSSDCSRLGLEACPCAGAENDIACTSCCRRKGEKCLSAKKWTTALFTEMQHYIARLCWRDSVLTCISSSSKWTKMLSSLSHYKPKFQGKIYCLKTLTDSNCWQLDFTCDKHKSKHKSTFSWT